MPFSVLLLVSLCEIMRPIKEGSPSSGSQRSIFGITVSSRSPPAEICDRTDDSNRSGLGSEIAKEVFNGGFMDEPSRLKGETNTQSPKEGSPFAAPSISLPKGGGAIRGIGEKFAANPVTGTGSMTVPIATSPGRSGFGPQLSLSYDSGAGNGPFGFGWNLSLPSITRKTDKGLPRYMDGGENQLDSDVFILSGAEDLVPEIGLSRII